MFITNHKALTTLAKEGSRITQIAKQNIPYETIKRLIKSNFIAKYAKIFILNFCSIIKEYLGITKRSLLYELPSCTVYILERVNIRDHWRP